MTNSTDENYIFHEGFKHVVGEPCSLCKFDFKGFIKTGQPVLDLQVKKAYEEFKTSIHNVEQPCLTKKVCDEDRRRGGAGVAMISCHCPKCSPRC